MLLAFWVPLSHLGYFGKCGVLHGNDVAAKACKSNILVLYVWTFTEVFAKSSLRWHSHIVWIMSSVFVLLIWLLCFSCLCCRVDVWLPTWREHYRTVKQTSFTDTLTNFVLSKLSNPLQSDCHHLFDLELCSTYSHCSCKWCQMMLFIPSAI